MTSTKLHQWEAALLLAFGLTLTVGAWAGRSEATLAGQVLRLHVVANSDSEGDQALKLLARDAVLDCAGKILDGSASREDAEELLAGRLDELSAAAAGALMEAGCTDEVTAALVDGWFPTKVYDGFSLPAGRYRALKITIGAGKGHNWWCVVFPPLCLGSVTEHSVETAAGDALSDDQVALITGQDGGYVLKFRLLEWWGEFTEKLGH